MLVLEDITRLERLVLDGEWILKLRGGDEMGRFRTTDYKHVSITENSTRRWLLFGPKRPYLAVHMSVGPSIMSLRVEPERRGEVDAFFAAVEKAKAETTAR